MSTQETGSSWPINLTPPADAGVDWLTVTATSHEKQHSLYRECKSIADGLEMIGDQYKKWSFHGYVGFKCGGIRWGTRQDSGIAVISGYDARANWLALLSSAENVTRCDLAVTTEVADCLPDLAETMYSWLNGEGKELLSKKLKYMLVVNSDKGQTLYVGSRCSDQFGRVYDKGMESKIPDVKPGQLWRYEVEFKGKRAKTIAKRLTDGSNLSSINQAIAATVFLWFNTRHVPPLWRRHGKPACTRIEARVTGDEISLHWLSTQVSPTVKRLCAKGKTKDVILALSLEDTISLPEEKVDNQ